MKLREKIAQKRFLGPLFGLVFAFFLCFVNSQSTSAKPLDTPIHTTPLTVFADPIDGIEEPEEPTDIEEPTDTETPADTEEESEEDPETCYDQVKGIGWLVCPTSGVLAKAVDSIYKVINDLLVVQPMTTDSESPVFIVWQYIRDLTNIVFIIMIIIVIYSHLTGVGFDNYNIKKILPKLIISAILINLSYLICAALVDTSNIAGASLRGFFEGVENQINANGDAMITWEAFAAILGGSGAIGGIAVSAAGGISAVLPMFLLSLISAFISILIGLATIAMRQAVVALLVMIAPLAFVLYMLPNTNKWFTKWKDTFTTMLIFFPMFSALFGASHLAGWAIIAKAQQDGSLFMTILGMAVQVVPFFLAIPMMKMSSSILGKVSSALDNFGKGATGRLRPVAEDFRDTAKARKLAEASTRNFNPISGASWAAYARSRKDMRAESRAKNEGTIKDANAIRTDARRTGRRIIGWNEDGTPMYASRILRDKNGNIMRDEYGKALRGDRVKTNRDMLEEYKSRQMSLRASGEKDRMDAAMGEIGSYMQEHDIKDKTLETLSKGQAKNYLYHMTQKSALARNARADQRFYTEEVRRASERDANGNIKHIRDYNRLIKAGAGADAYDKDETIRQNALTTVTADAYEAYEKERAETSKRYATLFDKQVTKDVLAQYKSALRSANIDAVTAAQNTLAARGDYDKISENLRNFMDQTGEYQNLGDDKRVRLGTDFANNLASNLLGMKGADPSLGRLGKSINMETWQATNGNRGEVMTFQDYVFGGNAQLSNNAARTSLIELLKGTPIKDADRTFFNDLIDTAAAYNLNEDQYTELINGMMPQFISGIPAYESGGEQILNAMKVVTGMAKKDGKWQRPIDTNGNFTMPIHTELISKYIGGMTDKDLNSFKTDAFEAICEAIAQSNGTTCYDANNEFQGNNLPAVVTDFLRDKVNKDALAIIQNNVNQGTNGGMKPKVMRAFGIDVPDTLPSTQNNP